jgi:hypothetical protein
MQFPYVKTYEIVLAFLTRVKHRIKWNVARLWEAIGALGLEGWTHPIIDLLTCGDLGIPALCYDIRYIMQYSSRAFFKC